VAHDMAAELDDEAHLSLPRWSPPVSERPVEPMTPPALSSNDRVVRLGLSLAMRDLEPGDPPLPRPTQLWRLVQWLFRWCGFTIPALGLTMHFVVPGNHWPAALLIAYTVGQVAAIAFAAWYRRQDNDRTDGAVRFLTAISLWLGVVLGLLLRPALQSDDPERYALICLTFATVSAGVNALVTAGVPRTYDAFILTAQMLFVVQFLAMGTTYFRWLAIGTMVTAVSMAIVARQMRAMLSEALLHRIEQGDTSERLRHAIARLDEIAATDDLTGLPNRRRFLDQLERHIEASERAPACVIMFDIDHFKDINDTFGHAVGDQVLRRVADAARMVLRNHDAIGRVGGEEFAVVCRARSERTAAVVAERIRQSIEELVHPESEHLRVTASFGIAQVRPGSAATVALDHADTPLYIAKSKGRNRVELAGFPVPEWPAAQRSEAERRQSHLNA
jgi:diguanylate cyclase (GGDEF)-like protein